MSEWWAGMALIGGILGGLILLGLVFEWAFKESVREIRDIWHEDDEDEDEEEEAPPRRRRIRY